MKKNRLFHLAFLSVAVLLAQDSRAQNGVELGDAFEQMVTSSLTSESANSGQCRASCAIQRHQWPQLAEQDKLAQQPAPRRVGRRFHRKRRPGV